ncbi:MAG: DUF378 domain-containing protein [Gammaproteobacteria bacterium]|nr:DUF378 domain-containing protein [Gammaproteobacteria bacterium]
MLIKTLDWIALILLIIGGLDLGVVGLFNYDPIIDIFSAALIVAHTFFFSIGLAAVYGIFRVAQVLSEPQPL